MKIFTIKNLSQVSNYFQHVKRVMQRGCRYRQCGGLQQLVEAHRLAAQQVVGQDDGGHSFDDGYGAGYDAWVVSPPDIDSGFLAPLVDGLLWSGDGRNRFEGAAEIDGHAIADAALCAS